MTSCRAALTTGFTALLWCSAAVAAGFGIFDARSLSMGGASVAVLPNDHAAFYNPALLAFNDEFEERNRDGRFHFPLLVAQISDSLIDIEDLNNDNLDANLSNSIAQFNADPNVVTARLALAASSDLRSVYESLAGDDVLADGYVGLAVSEPSRLEGGGVFVGLRIVGGGRTAVTEADLALLSQYNEALTFAATEGQQGSAQPQLLDANGNLLDPNAALDSSASARGAFIAEVGVAISKEIIFLGRSIVLGATPKVMSVETFDEDNRLVDDRLGTDNSISHLSLNADLGAAAKLGERFRLGLAVKDAIPRKWSTGRDNRVELNPKARLGIAAALTSGFTVAFDLDLNTNKPVADEFEVQEAALGVEWRIRPWLSLRGGYRHDLESNRDAIASAGAGFRWGNWLMDVAYATGDDLTGGAVQLGYAF